MACKGKHFTAQPQKFDTITIVLPEHLHNISCVSQSQLLHKGLTSFDAPGLIPIRLVLGCMGRLIGVSERMSVFNDRGNSACAGAEDWRI